MSRISFATVAAVLFLLAVPAAAPAAAPVCAADAALYELPAGLTWLNPRAPCTDADGDAITIEVADAPDFGSLSPGGAQPIDARRFYTANANAAGNRDSMKFVAVANGEQSNEFQVDVWILPAHQAPVCKDLAVSVRAGSSVAIAPSCTDPDGDTFKLNVLGAPKHGTYDPTQRTYTAARRYAGRDTMTFAVVDEWKLASLPRKVAITVTPGAGPTLSGDETAPRLKLKALRSRSSVQRGIRLRANASEAGRVVIEAFVGPATALDLGIERRVGTLARDLPAGKTAFRLRLDRDVRAQLGTLRRVRLRLVAHMVDAAGNVRTKRLTVRLRP
ncbi:MAG TPA: Ig-like domain-containing protein [Solirubrobacteraceae bacterium]|nr:Ig-like domain-containing protein [Solirubrobacteraceae bacterium]